MRYLKQPSSYNNFNQQQRQQQINRTSDFIRVGRSKLSLQVKHTPPSISTYFLLMTVFAAGALPIAAALDLAAQDAQLQPSNAAGNHVVANQAVANQVAATAQQAASVAADHSHDIALSAGTTRYSAMRQLIADKTVYDSESNKELIAQNCYDLEETIADMLQRGQQHHQHIERALKSKVMIVCLDDTRADALFPKTTTTGTNAMFAYTHDMLFFRTEKSVPSNEIISHEIMHADNFYLHKNKQCLTIDPVDAATPIFPLTEHNRAEYENAFKLGEQRVKDFEKLYLKAKDRAEMTVAEQQQLKQYEEACKDCFLTEHLIGISEKVYNDLRRQGATKVSLNKDGTPLSKFGGLRVIDIDKIRGYPILRFKFLDPVQAVLFMPYHVKEQLSSGYQYGTKNLKLAETEAYVLSVLSPTAAKVFYPEANELREKYINRCRPSG